MFWILILPGMVLCLIASVRLRRVYKKHLTVPVESDVSGFEAARKILDASGLTKVPVMEIRGYFTDHYDLLNKRLCLSSENYRGRSIAAVGIAAHEAGHALQHHEDYAPLRLRKRLTPVMSLAAPLSVTLILVGLFVKTSSGHSVLLTGMVFFALATVFQLLMLPVELDASRRAKAQLIALGLISESESERIGNVLNAAAMTYLAVPAPWPAGTSAMPQ